MTVVDRDGPRTAALTDPLVQAVDDVQYSLGEGPCLGVIDDHTVFVAPNLSEETRWPRFAQGAIEVGDIHRVIAFRLQLGEGKGASLNLYGLEPYAFGEGAMALGALLTAHTDAMLALRRSDARADNLERALASNGQIGVAMGILMARHGVTEDQAFDMLRIASQHLNRKVRDLAVAVAHTGELPSREPGRDGGEPSRRR